MQGVSLGGRGGGGCVMKGNLDRGGGCPSGGNFVFCSAQCRIGRIGGIYRVFED